MSVDIAFFTLIIYTMFLFSQGYNQYQPNPVATTYPQQQITTYPPQNQEYPQAVPITPSLPQTWPIAYSTTWWWRGE